MIRIHDVEQGSPAWHELRRIYPYTGTAADKLLRFGQVEYSKNTATDFKGNFYTKRGHILEDEAIELYQKLYRSTVSRPGFITNDDYPICGYSPDGIDGDLVRDGAVLLEVKCFNEKTHMAIYEGEVPFKILAQIHFGLLVCNLREARLIIYNPDFAKREIKGEPNPRYDPKKAIKVITIKANRDIKANFRTKLKKEVTHA